MSNNKTCSKINEWLHTGITLWDVLRAHIGLSSITAISISVIDCFDIFTMRGEITIILSQIGVLINIAVVLWTASITFLLFSIERLEVVNLGIRLRQILRVAVGDDRHLLHNSLILLVGEVVLLIIAAWSCWAITCFTLTLLMALNLVYVVLIVLLYNSRMMALRCVSHDAHNKINQLSQGTIMKKKNLDKSPFIPALSDGILYPIFRIVIGIGGVFYHMITFIIIYLLRLFIRFNASETAADMMILGEETKLAETDWLIYKMCRNMDYNNREDCVAMEGILKDIDENIFVGKRKLLVKCISTILEESENVGHTGDIIKGLYEKARAKNNGNLDLRKALIESILLTGKPEHIRFLNSLENNSWRDMSTTNELKISYWKYICSLAGQKRAVLGAPVGRYLYREPEDISKEDMEELLAQLAHDEDSLNIEFLQNICIL